MVGFWKRVWEEQTEYGFSTDRHFDDVCADCIGDEALKRFVSRHGSIDKCGFCGQTDTLGLHLGALFIYMASCIHTEWEDANGAVAWEHGFVHDSLVMESYDLLECLDRPLKSENLHREFIKAFDHPWCERNPYRLEYSEMLFLSWSRFCEMTKTDRRYFWHRASAKDNSAGDELLDPSEVPDEVGRAVRRVGWKVIGRTLGVPLFRARARFRPRKFHTARELGSPPSKAAKNNRMSGAGISMFYGAESEKTAIAEIRPSAGKAVTVGTWRPCRELVYLDLLAAQPIPSIFDQTARGDRTWLRFLAEFAADLARSIHKNDAAIEYVPTQIMTEYIRDHLPSPDGRPVEAIRYPSATDTSNGVCWVVFANQDDCGDSCCTDRLLLLDTSSLKHYRFTLLYRLLMLLCRRVILSYRHHISLLYRRFILFFRRRPSPPPRPPFPL